MKTKRVGESLTLIILKETTDITGSLSGLNLHLGAGVIGINETSRVILNLLEPNTVRANGHNKLLSITKHSGRN